MTTKDYIRLSNAINELADQVDSDENESRFDYFHRYYPRREVTKIAVVLRVLCDVLKSDNKHFDRERFLDACFMKRAEDKSSSKR